MTYPIFAYCNSTYSIPKSIYIFLRSLLNLFLPFIAKNALKEQRPFYHSIDYIKNISWSSHNNIIKIQANNRQNHFSKHRLFLLSMLAWIIKPNLCLATVFVLIHTKACNCSSIWSFKHDHKNYLKWVYK